MVEEQIPEQQYTLGFKLIAASILSPAKQSEHWDKFKQALEAEGMMFAGGHDKHGFEGTISGKVTREYIISLLRAFAIINCYSILVEIPVIEPISPGS